MATEEQDRQQHIRYITETTITEATGDYFHVLHAIYHAENNFKENDRVRVTIERVVEDVRPDSDNQIEGC